MLSLMLLFSVLCYILILAYSSPIFLILSLLLETISLVLYITYYSLFSWLGYTLILLFWGSMMILFLYCVCLSPNPEFNFPAKSFFAVEGLYLFLVMSMICGSSLYSPPFSGSMTGFLLGSMLMSSSSVYLYIYTVANLLLILLVVCEMSKTKKGTLSLNS